MKSLVQFFLCLGLLSVLSAPALLAQREKFSQEDVAFIEKTWPAAKKTNTGIRYIIEQPGSGDKPKAGDNVSVLYVGKVLNGDVFDQATDKNKPFMFRVGRDQVIQGWDQILPQMQLGEKRMVIIPPELAYGTRGQAPKIPRSTSLVFTIELIEIKRD